MSESQHPLLTPKPLKDLPDIQQPIKELIHTSWVFEAQGLRGTLGYM